MNQTYIDTALMLYKNLFTIEKVKKLILWSEEAFGKRSMLDSVYKCEKLLQICKGDHSRMIWVFEMMFDKAFNRDSIAASDMGFNTLTGKTLPNGKGP